MKRKMIVLFVIACLALVGCEESGRAVTPTVRTVQMEYSDFDLVIDEKTGIVYIDNAIKTGEADGFNEWWHIYTPYYGKCGNPCKFIDGKVVEL